MKHLEDQGIPTDLAKNHSRVAWARLNDALIDLVRQIVMCLSGSLPPGPKSR
jgi:hypothetical protein